MNIFSSLQNQKAKKSLGQHFLINNHIINKITSFITEDSLVVEIGPGTGNLTKSIIANKHATKIIAIEKDIEISKKLSEEVKNIDKLEIINGDAKNFNWESIVQKYQKKITLISNLPYNCGTEILYNALHNIECFSDIIIMLQKEVVDRILSSENNKIYGSLSILSQILCDVKKIISVKPNNFVPPPKVQSSVVRLKPKKDILSKKEISLLSKFLKIGFSNKRKKISSNFKDQKCFYNLLREENLLNKRMEELSPSIIFSIIKKCQ